MKNKLDNNKLGVLGLITVTIIWGSGFVASDIALSTITTSQIMTFRFFLGTVVMFILGFREIKHITKKELICGILLGVSLFVAFFLQTYALNFTTPAKNAFLTSTNVIFVPFIAFLFLKKKVGIKSIIGAVLAIIGAGVLSIQNDFSLGLGDGLTLICAICFAVHIFLTGVYVKKISVLKLNFLQMAVAFVLSLGSLTVLGEFNTFSPSTESLFAVLYLGLISTTLAYFIQTVSQKYVDETKAAIILSMEAIFGTIFSIIILHEEITTKIIIGSALIFSAVLVSQIKLKAKS